MPTQPTLRPTNTHTHAHTLTWSVVPPMWQAAAPVLAVIKVLWGGNIVIKREIWLASSGTTSKKHTLSSSYGVYHCPLFRYKIHLKRTQRPETSSFRSAVFIVSTIRIAFSTCSFNSLRWYTVLIFQRPFLAVHCEIVVCKRAYVFIRPHGATSEYPATHLHVTE